MNGEFIGKTYHEIAKLVRNSIHSVGPAGRIELEKAAEPVMQRLSRMGWDKQFAKARTAARKACCSIAGVNVDIVAGTDKAPEFIEGQDGHWTTPSGKTRVYHPSAYSKKGRCVYHARTHKVVVGELWLEAHK